MIDYNNIDIESTNKSSGGTGLITGIKILMNSSNDTKSAIITAKRSYENILEKGNGNKVNIITDSIRSESENEI